MSGSNSIGNRPQATSLPKAPQASGTLKQMGVGSESKASQLHSRIVDIMSQPTDSVSLSGGSSAAPQREFREKDLRRMMKLSCEPRAYKPSAINAQVPQMRRQMCEMSLERLREIQIQSAPTPKISIMDLMSK